MEMVQIVVGLVVVAVVVEALVEMEVMVLLVGGHIAERVVVVEVTAEMEEEVVEAEEVMGVELMAALEKEEGEDIIVTVLLEYILVAVVHLPLTLEGLLQNMDMEEMGSMIMAQMDIVAFASYSIILKGLISMIHPHNLMTMSIAPPPKATSIK